MYKVLFSVIIMILPFTLLSGKGEYTKDAHCNSSDNTVSIIRNYDASFTLQDMNNATYKVMKVVTVLSKQGDEFANFHGYGDKFRELKDFSGVIKNASGSIIKKISKKDLTISSLSDQMATDSYSIMYECKVPTYPYTVEYTYTEKWKNGIISYPRFAPMEGYLQSVENANYIIELPPNMNLRYISNFDCTIKDQVGENKHIYSFSAKDLKAIEWEPLAPPLRERYPRVIIAPTEFCFDQQCGNMSDWNSYGVWVSGLLKDRDILLDETKAKIKDLVKDCKSDKEKVEVLYKYLQGNTRYVSIQLGIGGFQPINASTVFKTGYGDCKGLSNLMKAFLKVVDIPSNYCEISMSEKELYKDFTNVNQTDHAILLVPLERDSVWLECTSQTLPFNYIHEDIAGHDALVITDNGAKICRLPSYTDQQNKKISIVNINVAEDGTAKGNISFTENLHGYASSKYYTTSNNRERMVEYINRNMKLPKIQLDNLRSKEEKTSLPSCELSADFIITDFANKTGSRLFIPICPLNKGNYNIFTSSKREQDIHINYGFSESDSIIINIPEGYASESLPKDIFLETPFGKLEIQIKVEENKILYIQNIDILSGKYDKGEYEGIKSFFSQITSATTRKFVLKKL